MRRRTLILYSWACAALAITGAHAQAPTAPRRLGWLAMSTPENSRLYEEVFTARMRELGFVEGRDYTVERRYAEGKLERVSVLARELLSLKPDLVVASTSPAAMAFKQETTTVPVVFVTVVNPENQGLVASLARPGGNMTGVGNRAAEMEAKLRELVRELVPGARRAAILVVGGDTTLAHFLSEIQQRFEAAGFAVDLVPVKDALDFEPAIARVASRKADVLYVPSYPFFVSQARRLGELALRARLPMVGPRRAFAAAGGLLSYDNDLKDDFRGAAAFVAKILRGAKPADLPVEHPDRFHLAINLRTAKALGIKIPQSVLLRADEVIE